MWIVGKAFKIRFFLRLDRLGGKRVRIGRRETAILLNVKLVPVAPQSHNVTNDICLFAQIDNVSMAENQLGLAPISLVGLHLPLEKILELFQFPSEQF